VVMSLLEWQESIRSAVAVMARSADGGTFFMVVHG
jgi:hypothetical protein